MTGSEPEPGVIPLTMEEIFQYIRDVSTVRNGVSEGTPYSLPLLLVALAIYKFG